MATRFGLNALNSSGFELKCQQAGFLACLFLVGFHVQNLVNKRSRVAKLA